MEMMRNINLDKICRICLTEKRDMRCLFGESIATMVNEICPEVSVSRVTPMCEIFSSNYFAFNFAASIRSWLA